METQRINDELLKLILAKLNRLERHFTEIDSRLSVIEFSILPAPDSTSNIPAVPASSTAASRRCSCHIPQPVFQSFHVDWERQTTASAYKASVDKLRNRFEFDGQSEYPSFDIGVASTCGGRSEMSDVFINNYDNYSVSVYPSRPVSNYGSHLNDLRPAPVDIPGPPSQRYEDMPISEEILVSPSTTNTNTATSSSRSRSRSRRNSIGSPMRRFSTRKGSASTARTSVTSSVSENESAAKPASFSKLRGSIRRATSLSVPRRKTPPASDGEVVLANSKETAAVTAERAERIRSTIMQEQDLERFVQFMQKSAKACVWFVPNMISEMGKRMMNQQLKMLDVMT